MSRPKDNSILNEDKVESKVWKVKDAAKKKTKAKKKKKSKKKKKGKKGPEDQTNLHKFFRTIEQEGIVSPGEVDELDIGNLKFLDKEVGKTNESALDIFVLNCRSIKSIHKRKMLQALLEKEGPDIAILTETWLSEPISNVGMKSSFVMQSKSAHNEGVLISTRTRLNPRMIQYKISRLVWSTIR